MKLISVKERLKEIQEIMSRAIYKDNESQVIMNIRNSDCPNWDEFIGKSLTKGQIVLHNNIKYLTMQDVSVVLENQSPSDTAMLAVYKPYRDSGEYEWLYGEYVEIGWIRSITTETTITRYKAIQDPNANIYSPNLVPSVWQLISTEEI